MDQLDIQRDGNEVAKRLLLGIDPSAALPANYFNPNNLDADALRERTLE